MYICNYFIYLLLFYVQIFFVFVTILCCCYYFMFIFASSFICICAGDLDLYLLLCMFLYFLLYLFVFVLVTASHCGMCRRYSRLRIRFITKYKIEYTATKSAFLQCTNTKYQYNLRHFKITKYKINSTQECILQCDPSKNTCTHKHIT